MRTTTILVLLGLAGTVGAVAQTTVSVTNHLAWGANVGWIDCRGNVSSGLRVGRYYCAGYLYAANVGWINLGGGAPVNGYAYQNHSATDFGVNTDAAGNLRGYAWGANIGWINFESNGGARVDLRTGQLSGYAYSANCGWLSLSNTCAKVVTDSLWPGQTEASGLPVAWEMLNFGARGVNAAADPDGDGLSNWAEYVAGTNPRDSADVLRITAFTPGATGVTITWNSVPARNYAIEETDRLGGPWASSPLGTVLPDGPLTTRTLLEAGAATKFYRVKAIMPLGQ